MDRLDRDEGAGECSTKQGEVGEGEDRMGTGEEVKFVLVING